MNPAIQYLTRTKLIRSWFNTPCSIFLENSTSQIIVTIGKGKDSDPRNPSFIDGINGSDSLRVKNWFLANCDKENILPPFDETTIHQSELFSHPNVIIEGFKPFFRRSQTVPSHYNSMRGPMSEELYSFFFDNTVNGTIHQKCRKIWLWRRFVSIYLPELSALQAYINEYGSEADFVTNQMEIVEYHFQKLWQSWKKWENYFLLPVPGELIFGKEYGSL